MHSCYFREYFKLFVLEAEHVAPDTTTKSYWKTTKSALKVKSQDEVSPEFNRFNMGFTMTYGPAIK